MASSTRSGRILKHEETSISRTPAKAKKIKDSLTPAATASGTKNKVSNSTSKDNTKTPASSGSAAENSSSLRRSSRETFTQKTRVSSPGSRKSARHENQAPPTLSDKKAERVEKKRPRSPLRRSERIEKNGTSSSGLKKVKISSSPTAKKNKDNENEKLAKEITDSQSKKAILKKKGKLDAFRYRALLQPKKYKSSDTSLSKENSSNSGTRGSKRVSEGIDECSGKKRGKINGLGGDSKEADEGSISGSREDADITLGNIIQRKSARIGSKQKFEDKTPVSKCRDSSLQSSQTEAQDGTLSEKKIHVEDGRHDTHKLDIVKLESSELMDSTSEGKCLAVDKSTEYEVEIKGLKSTKMVVDLDSDVLVTTVHKDFCIPGISTGGISSSSPCGSKSKDIKRCSACNKPDRVYISSDSQDSCVCNVQRGINSLQAVVEMPGELISSPCGSETPKNEDNVKPMPEASKTSPGSKRQDNLNRPPDKEHVPVPVDMDRETPGVSDTMCISEGHLNVTHQESAVVIQNYSDTDACVVCKNPGQLLCCDGKGCMRNYHLSCLNPPLQDVPPGAWLCVFCVKKKVEFGVYSVSEGIESVWDVKEGMQNGKQYFVKYKGLSHIHNRWVPESEMLLEAPILVSKFDKRRQKEKVTRWKQEWAQPCRLLLKRQLMPKNVADESFGGHADILSSSYHEWLVKWKGLGYEYATWELENSPFLRSSEGRLLVSDFESRHGEAKRRSNPSLTDKVLLTKRSPFQKLTRLPDDCRTGLDNDYLNSVNRLHEFWHKSHNAIFLDEQERFIKTVLFISSLKSCICQPILVVSTVSSLSLWETELIRLAPSINVVVYSGSKKVRKMIRAVDFYEEGGCLLFQVLLSHPDAIIEDFDALENINWEALIIDECQNPRVSKHLEHLKNLSAEFKLLLFSGQLKGNLAEYLNLLSFLEPGGKENSANSSKYATNESAGALAILKEKLARYLAYERKPESSKFMEYWVPVWLSNVQLEQYCSTIISNSITLRSCQKVDQVGALRDILISTRKCCDHPYLVCQSLQSSLTKDLPLDMYLDIGVKSSGKLHLLDKVLHEIKKKGLRLLILFQSIGGAGRDSIGDILDDFLRQRFGANSYERVDSGLVMSKKLAAMNMFNDKANGRFVFLIENRACLPSIKLSSVDAVVIFNSDWNPLNDLRALQKIHIESQFEHVKVFRLYSSYTVEEKVLIFAKQDMILESNIQNITPSNSHMLLSWGAFHLFDELEEFHKHDSLNNCSVNLADKCLVDNSKLEFLNDVQLELLKQLPKEVENNIGQSSLLIKAQQSGASYSRTISLVGEKDGISSLDKDPPSFWSNLLENKFPKWKFVSESSQRVRRKVQHIDGSVKVPNEGNDESRKKRKTVTTNTVDPISLQTWFEDIRKGMGKDNKVLDDISPHSSSQPGPISQTTMSSDLPKKPASMSHNAAELNKFPIVESDGRHNAQRNLHLLLRRELSQLCDTLKLQEDVKVLAHRLLDYVMNNHHVSQDPETILQALKLSLCWRASFFLKYKVDHGECLALAKKFLNYSCDEEQVCSVYSKLRMLKKVFSRTNPLRQDNKSNYLENQSCALRSAEVGEEMQGGTSNSASCHLQELGEIKAVSGGPRSTRDLIAAHKQAAVGENLSNVKQDLGSLKDALFLKKQIDLIDVVFSKREASFLLKQRGEISDFNVQKEEERLMLKNAHDVQLDLIRSIHTDCTVRNEKSNLLNQDISKKMAEFDQHMNCQREKLKVMQQAAQNTEHIIRDCWIEEARVGILAVRFDTFPLTESGFRLEKFRDVMQVEDCNGSIMNMPESAEQVEACNGSITYVPKPASCVMSADMTATGPVASIGATASLSSSHGWSETEHARTSLSSVYPEEEFLQPNGTTAETLPTVALDTVEAEFAGSNQTSAVIPASILSEEESLQPKESTGKTLPTDICDMVEVESTEPNELSAEILASFLPEGDDSMLKDKEAQFYGSHVINVSSNHADETPTLPTVEAAGLPLEPEPDGACIEAPAAHLEKGDKFREKGTAPSQLEIVITAGDGSDGILVGSTIGTTEATSDKNPHEGDNNIAHARLLPSSMQCPVDLPSQSPSSPGSSCKNSVSSNLVPSTTRHDRLAVSIDTGYDKASTYHQQITIPAISPVDAATSQNEPTDHHTSTSNPTLLQASPAAPLSAENGQGSTHERVGDEGTPCIDSREQQITVPAVSPVAAATSQNEPSDHHTSSSNPLLQSSPAAPLSAENGQGSTHERVADEGSPCVDSREQEITIPAVSPVDAAASQNEPTDHHTCTSNTTLLQASPAAPLSAENDQGSTHETIGDIGTPCIDSREPSCQPSGLSMQQLSQDGHGQSNILTSQSVLVSNVEGICAPLQNGQSMQEQINQLSTLSIVHPLPRDTELPLQQPVVTSAVMQTAQSNQFSLQSVAHPLLQSANNCETSVLLPSVTVTSQSNQRNQLVSDFVANLLPERTRSEVHGNTAILQEHGSQSIQMFPISHWVHPQVLHPDPLQNELLRIQKQEELRSKMHEDKKLQLERECEQEVEKIRKKYNALLQDADTGFHQDKKILEQIYNKVLVNQIFAREFRAKFIESKAGSSAAVYGRASGPTMPQQYLQTSQPAVRSFSAPSPVPTIPSSGNQPPLPSPRLPSSSPLPLSRAPASSSVTPEPYIRPTPPTILPANSLIRSQFNPMPPPNPNTPPGSGARAPASRAPAPHLHRFRPQASMMAPIPPHSNLGTMSTAATVPPVHSSSLPPSSGGTNQPSVPASQLPPSLGASMTAPFVELPREMLEVGPTLNSASAGVVCLSDDE